VYSQNSIDINFLYQSIDVIEELDSKQRKIRSFRGFFLYALEIIEKGKDYEILTTNLQPFFWRKVKTIIRQNQKGALLEFLFGEYANRKTGNKGSDLVFQQMEKKMETLQNQVNSLEQKIIQLEHNQNIVRERNLNVVSGGSKMDFKASSRPQQDSIASDQSKAQNQSNFSILSKIPEQEIIEIIQKGFQLNQEGKISLKKYYESKQEHSLFQSKGYKIKYETIRRTKLYQQFKF